MAPHGVVVGKPHLGAHRHHQHTGHELPLLLRHLHASERLDLLAGLGRIQKDHGIGHRLARSVGHIDLHRARLRAANQQYQRSKRC